MWFCQRNQVQVFLLVVGEGWDVMMVSGRVSGELLCIAHISAKRHDENREKR